MSGKAIHFVHEGEFAAEVTVAHIEDQTNWSPYVSFDDMRKLDRVRLSLRNNDIESALKEARVFRLVPVASDEGNIPSKAREVASAPGFGEERQGMYSAQPESTGIIRAGIGGWTFEPWDESFYPTKLPKKRQLEYASRKLSTIEVNGTFYRSQTPETFAKWASEVPDGFVFSLKAPRFSTNRKVLGEAGESIGRFVASGIAELGDRLGPILWQFVNTKAFDPDDFGAFLSLLPRDVGGIALRHAVEVRHPSFVVPEFVALARSHGVAIVHADHASYPEIADATADFVYSRLQKGVDTEPTGYAERDIGAWAQRAAVWAAGSVPDDLPLAAPDVPAKAVPRDVFVYFIHEGKVRAPHAAQALMAHVPEHARPRGWMPDA